MATHQPQPTLWRDTCRLILWPALLWFLVLFLPVFLLVGLLFLLV